MNLDYETSGQRPGVTEDDRKALVACEIFKDELQAVFAPRPNTTHIVWLPAALHTDIDMLESKLEETLASLQDQGFGDIAVLYGGACSPGIGSVVARYGAVRPEGGNCLDILLGPERAAAVASEGAIVLTPGWIRAWPSIMSAMGWDEVDVRMNLGRYDLAAVFDAGIIPLTEEEILWFFDLSGLVVDIRPLDLAHFRNTLNALFNRGFKYADRGVDLADALKPIRKDNHWNDCST